MLINAHIYVELCVNSMMLCLFGWYTGSTNVKSQSAWTKVVTKVVVLLQVRSMSRFWCKYFTRFFSDTYPIDNYGLCIMWLQRQKRTDYDAHQLSSAADKRQLAQSNGTKGCYPDMRLPYHIRMACTSIDAMHTVKDVIVNIMDIILATKNFRCPKLELQKQDLHEADRRFNKLHLPSWIEIPAQASIITRPKGLKSHDWKEVHYTHTT